MMFRCGKRAFKALYKLAPYRARNSWWFEFKLWVKFGSCTGFFLAPDIIISLEKEHPLPCWAIIQMVWVRTGLDTVELVPVK